MLGGHFMEQSLLEVKWSVLWTWLVEFICIWSCLISMWTLSHCNISLMKVLSLLLRWIVGVKKKFGGSSSPPFLFFASFEKDISL